MELVDAFNTSMYVPNITTLQSLDGCLSSLGSFDSGSRSKLLQALTALGLGSKISVGVKKLIYMAEMASQDEEKVEKMVQLLGDEA